MMGEIPVPKRLQLQSLQKSLLAYFRDPECRIVACVTLSEAYRRRGQRLSGVTAALFFTIGPRYSVRGTFRSGITCEFPVR